MDTFGPFSCGQRMLKKLPAHLQHRLLGMDYSQYCRTRWTVGLTPGYDQPQSPAGYDQPQSPAGYDQPQ
jgi:hypothetical protein